MQITPMIIYKYFHDLWMMNNCHENNGLFLTFQNEQLLNNCKNVNSHPVKNVRLVNNLGSNHGKTLSWSKRNLLLKQQRSDDLKCNADLMASPWFQEGLSR